AVNRAEDRDTTIAENWTITGNYDRFLSTRLFVNANTVLTHDKFRDLDLRTALGAGLGYQVIDTARLKLTANGGVGWVDEPLHVGEDTRYTAAHESAKLDYFPIPRVQIFHNHDGYFGGDRNLFIRTQNGVRVGLFGRLVTTAQVDVDYDRSPAPGTKSTDRTYAVTFGYRF